MLTDRQKLILQAIILAYTETGHAIGSKALADKLSMTISSATIRNEMAILEEKGLIQKEHTSSGRIPSLAGYRYYVDNLKDIDMLVKKQDILTIRDSFNQNYTKVDEIIAQSTNMLSQLTSYTALAIKPETINTTLSGFRLVPLGSHQVMAILVTNNGDVESQQFAINKEVTSEQLEAVVRIVNDQLIGKSLDVVVKKLANEVPILINKYLSSPDVFLDTFDNVLNKFGTDHFFVGGRLNLLDFSSSDNPAAIKQLYELLNSKKDMHNMMNFNDQENDQTTISVKIGDEIANDLLKDYSLLTASYDVGDHGKGIIAILGPTRMPYSKTIGLLGAFRQELTSKLVNYYHFYDE